MDRLQGLQLLAREEDIRAVWGFTRSCLAVPQPRKVIYNKLLGGSRQGFRIGTTFPLHCKGSQHCPFHNNLQHSLMDDIQRSESCTSQLAAHSLSTVST